jgi:hypothetical protein
MKQLIAGNSQLLPGEMSKSQMAEVNGPMPKYEKIDDCQTSIKNLRIKTTMSFVKKTALTVGAALNSNRHCTGVGLAE